MLATSGITALFALALTATVSAPVNAFEIELTKRDLGLKSADGAVNIQALDDETARLTL